MTRMNNSSRPSQRRYSSEEKAAAVRMVRALRAELGTKNGTVKRVADQLGYGPESVRTWVRQADIDDGNKPGVSRTESHELRDARRRIRLLEQENEVLRREPRT